jgi:membrane protein DedA with SNARE-associated domain
MSLNLKQFLKEIIKIWFLGCASWSSLLYIVGWLGHEDTNTLNMHDHLLMGLMLIGFNVFTLLLFIIIGSIYEFMKLRSKK